jgi:purine-nucleoside phosphorylase
MSLHISAKPGDIAPIVLMPGDPLRAKFIAENRLDNIRLVSSTRNMLYYTGEYKGQTLTIGGSGMGCPSIGIYSYELYYEYEVDCILRIGTCGAYLTELKLYDLINAERAFSESTYAQAAFNMHGDHFYHQGPAYGIINETASRLGVSLRTGPVHSGDAFYRTGSGLPEIAVANNCLAAEMESFALFANAQLLNKMAATLLTVSDIIPDKQEISPDERERSLNAMTELALESALAIIES